MKQETSIFGKCDQFVLLSSFSISLFYIYYFFPMLQVMDLVVKEKFVLEERRISLSEFHTADEVFVHRYLSIYRTYNYFKTLTKKISRKEFIKTRYDDCNISYWHLSLYTHTDYCSFRHSRMSRSPVVEIINNFISGVWYHCTYRLESNV